MEIRRFHEKGTNAFRRYFPKNEDFARVKEELSRFLGCCNEFSSFDSMRDRWTMDLKG